MIVPWRFSAIVILYPEGLQPNAERHPFRALVSNENVGRLPFTQMDSPVPPSHESRRRPGKYEAEGNVNQQCGSLQTGECNQTESGHRHGSPEDDRVRCPIKICSGEIVPFQCLSHRCPDKQDNQESKKQKRHFSEPCLHVKPVPIGCGGVPQRQAPLHSCQLRCRIQN